METRKTEIKKRLEKVFEDEQASILAEVITDAYIDLVKTGDFNELKGIVKELAEAQKETEKRLTRLEGAVAELAEAQKRTEIKVAELAEAQKRTEQELVRFGRHFDMKLSAIGARWGIDSEASFREAIKFILEETEFKVEHYTGYDEEGIVFSRPDQVELDVIIKNAKVIIAEIKSSVNKNDVSIFNRKLRFYESQTGKEVTDKLIISPFIDPRGTEALAQSLGIKIITNPEDLQEKV